MGKIVIRYIIYIHNDFSLSESICNIYKQLASECLQKYNPRSLRHLPGSGYIYANINFFCKYIYCIYSSKPLYSNVYEWIQYILQTINNFSVICHDFKFSVLTQLRLQPNVHSIISKCFRHKLHVVQCVNTMIILIIIILVLKYAVCEASLQIRQANQAGVEVDANLIKNNVITN